MMGRHDPQKRLFVYNIDLDKRVRADHPLRKVAQQVDFEFVREVVKDSYGYNGNVSVPPEIVMKMMFLLFFEDVKSERELMRVIPERLDWMLFLGYGLEDKIPHHSVLSKARRRWGVEVFRELFVRVVWQCVQAGLVDGEKIHVDGSLVEANASNNSILKGPPELIEALRKVYQKEAKKLEEPEEEEPGAGARAEAKGERKRGVNRGLVSRTDPDAAVVNRPGRGRRARYKNHRVVDDSCGVITAVETTAGDVQENRKLMGLVQQHEANTQQKVKTVVADRQYGTAENFAACRAKGIRTHMADLKAVVKGGSRRWGVLGEEEFEYDERSDSYRCPAGQRLRRRGEVRRRGLVEYAGEPEVCRRCALRGRCTKARDGVRRIQRHYQQQLIEEGRRQSRSREAKADRVRRRWLMEGSFGDATLRHGFKRARWRRLWRQQIQDYLIAAIQNVRILIRYGMEGTRKVNVQRVPLPGGREEVAFHCTGRLQPRISHLRHPVWEFRN